MTHTEQRLRKEAQRLAKTKYQGAILPNFETGKLELWPSEYRRQLQDAFVFGYVSAPSQAQDDIERAICAAIICTLPKAGIDDSVKFLAAHLEEIGSQVKSHLKGEGN